MWSSDNTISGGVRCKLTIELKQKGHKIKGTLTSLNSIPNEVEQLNTFLIAGDAFDNYVDLEYRSDNKKTIGRGSLLFKIKDGGSKLEGSLVAIDRYTMNIMSSNNIIAIRQ